MRIGTLVVLVALLGGLGWQLTHRGASTVGDADVTVTIQPPAGTPVAASSTAAVPVSEGDVGDGVLPASSWPASLPPVDPADDDGQDDLWRPVAEGFAAAFVNTGIDHAAWLAGLAPYVTTNLLTLYDDPMVQQQVHVGTLTGMEPQVLGDTQVTVRLRFDDEAADCTITLVPSDTGDGWVVAAVA